MDRFFNPQKIVLFGASSNPHKGGHHVLKNIKQYAQHNEKIEFYIIHPSADIIEEVQCFRNIEDIKPEKIIFDLAIIVVPINAVMNTVRQCIKHNVRGILIESGQLDNDQYKALEYGAEIKSLIKGKNIRIVGPNSIGFNVPSLKYCTPLNYNPSYLETDGSVDEFDEFDLNHTVLLDNFTITKDIPDSWFDTFQNIDYPDVLDLERQKIIGYTLSSLVILSLLGLDAWIIRRRIRFINIQKE